MSGHYIRSSSPSLSVLRARSITRVTDSSRRCSMSKRVFLCCNRAVIEASFARHYKHRPSDVNRRAGPRYLTDPGVWDVVAVNPVPLSHQHYASSLRSFQASENGVDKPTQQQPQLTNRIRSALYSGLPRSPWRLLSPRAYSTVNCAHSCAPTFSPVFGFGIERHKKVNRHHLHTTLCLLTFCVASAGSLTA